MLAFGFTLLFFFASSLGVLDRYPWSDQYLMVEPHISTTLTLSSALYDSLGEDVQWEIEVASGSYIYPTGRIVTASFNDTGVRL